MVLINHRVQDVSRLANNASLRRLLNPTNWTRTHWSELSNFFSLSESGSFTWFSPTSRLVEVQGEIAALKNNQSMMQSTLNDILTEIRRSNSGIPGSPAVARCPPAPASILPNGISDHRSTSSPTPTQSTYYPPNECSISLT
jgi:hypothetical protein